MKCSMFLLVALAAGVGFSPGPATPAAPLPPQRKPDEWSMFGGSPGRNMANLTARNVVDDFDIERVKNILWGAQLGSWSVTQPVIAGGKIFVGTNNQQPRNKRDTVRNNVGEVEAIDRGILMCFDEKTGKLLWQAVHKKLASGRVNDWPEMGIASSPAVDGERVYYVSNRAEVMCVDINGFANGNQGFQGEEFKDGIDADVIWAFDMMKELDVFPHNLACCPPLVVGDIVFVVTGNGVDDSHTTVPKPDAPSFLALDKNTGKVLWKDNSPGKNIMHGQWGIPSYSAEPIPQVIFPGGDGWLRAFDPPTGKLLWKFNGNSKKAFFNLEGTGDKSDFVNCAPAVVNGRVYIGVGQDPEHSTGSGNLWCIDLKRAVEFGKTNKDADVSPVDDNFDPKVAVNAKSALVWRYGGEDKRAWAERDYKFGRTMSNMCVVDDVIYAAELYGILHCLDARTGERYWEYDTRASIWGSPYYADGKVFLGVDSGDLFIFDHNAKPAALPDPIAEASIAPNMRIAKQTRTTVRKQIEKQVLIRKVELDAPIRSTPSVANGVLYVNSEKTLYAIGKP